MIIPIQILIFITTESQCELGLPVVNIAYVIPNFLLFVICNLELMPIYFLFSLLMQFIYDDEIKLIEKERNTIGSRNYHLVCNKTQNESFAAF